MNYVEADEVKPGNALMFCPMPHQGKAEIVDVNELEISDPKAPGGRRKMLWTVFQRQRFEYVTTEVAATGRFGRGEGGADARGGAPGELPATHARDERRWSGGVDVPLRR